MLRDSRRWREVVKRRLPAASRRIAFHLAALHARIAHCARRSKFARSVAELFRSRVSQQLKLWETARRLASVLLGLTLRHPREALRTIRTGIH